MRALTVFQLEHVCRVTQCDAVRALSYLVPRTSCLVLLLLYDVLVGCAARGCPHRQNNTYLQATFYPL